MEAMWFRSMIPDADGRPSRGRSSRKLGVRVPGDVQPDTEGGVAPGGGGMSVAPDSM
jgi:hypothetical protein